MRGMAPGGDFHLQSVPIRFCRVALFPSAGSHFPVRRNPPV